MIDAFDPPTHPPTQKPHHKMENPQIALMH